MRLLQVGLWVRANRNPNRVCSLVFALLSLTLLAGCKPSESKDAGPPFLAADAQRQADLAALPQVAGSLQEAMAAEVSARPRDTSTLEGIIEGVGKEVSFAAPRQLYGRKLLALYCGSVDSLDGLIITVCEYAGEAQARRGQVEGNTVNSMLPGHQSRVHKKSVLFLVSRSDTPADSVAKVLSAFEAQ
jgi:hypothetical protein